MALKLTDRYITDLFITQGPEGMNIVCVQYQDLFMFSVFFFGQGQDQPNYAPQNPPCKLCLAFIWAYVTASKYNCIDLQQQKLHLVICSTD